MDMKKYIAPTAKFCILDTESMLASSDPSINDEYSDKDQDSNRRRNSIWGDEY